MKEFNLDPILLILFKNLHQYTSGEDIAQSLKLTRAAIHKNIIKLQEQNYNIKGIPQKGFQLQTPYPYKILPELIKSSLPENNQIDFYFTNQIDSTNKLAFRLLSNKNSFFILTRDQVVGKGRMNREWIMDADKDIALTFVIKDSIPQYKLFSLIRMSSLAVCNTLNYYCLNTFKIKWPNDIISYNNKKICGILTETIAEEGNINSVIIGIGININGINNYSNSTSLRELLKKEIDINQIIIQLTNNILYYYQQFINNEDIIIKEWQYLLAWQDEEVILYKGNQILKGILKSVNYEGVITLIINEKEYEFISGDLENIRLQRD